MILRGRERQLKRSARDNMAGNYRSESAGLTGISDTKAVCGLMLNWNRWAATVACLESLLVQTVPLVEIIVVDNGSDDDSVEQIRRRFPQVIVLETHRNLGFSAGCNVGLERALALNYDYVLLVNNDTVLAPEALACLLREACLDVGILSPKIFYASEPDRIWSIGGGCHPLTLEKTDDARGQLDDSQRYKTCEREYLVGCGMLISLNALREVGLFDTRFFLYYEDSDLSLRFRQAGFRLVMVGDAHMWHKVATSSGGADSPAERYYMAKSSIIFFRKHVDGLRWLIVGPYRLGSALKTTWRLARQRRFDSIRAYWRGLRDGLRLPIATTDVAP